MSSSSRDSQDESKNTNQSTSNNSLESSQNKVTNSNTDEFTELPHPAVTRKRHSMDKTLDEIPPPPYSKVSNMQMPAPSHSRDHTSITIASLPEYSASDSSITTTQPQIIPHPSRSHNLSTDELLSSKLCKICHESEDQSDGQYEEKLISPCKCKGSLQYVHIGCLNRWRHSNVREDASYRCEVCKYEYRFYRPRVARIFSNGLTLHFLTLVLLLSSIYLFSFFVKLLDSHETTDPPPKLPKRWRNIQFLNLRLIHYVYGTAIVSLFGLIFFMCMICFKGFRHTRNDYCYCGGCGYPLFYCNGGGGSCISTDGDCGAIFLLIILVILAVIFMFGFIGAIIAAYLFTQKIISICLDEVHDRILEVKKD